MADIRRHKDALLERLQDCADRSHLFPADVFERRSGQVARVGKSDSFFPTALVTSILPKGTFIPQTMNAVISEKCSRLTWNYWRSDSPNRKDSPLPDDADDTFCALAAIAKHVPSAIDPSSYASIIANLIRIENALSGPYRTWFVPEHSKALWQNVDPAVNANIAYFLKESGIGIPKNLREYLSRQLGSETTASDFYGNEAFKTYLVARAIGNIDDSWIMTMIGGRLGRAGNAVEKLCLLNSLIHLSGWGLPLSENHLEIADAAIRSTLESQAAPFLLYTEKRSEQAVLEISCPAMAYALALETVSFAEHMTKQDAPAKNKGRDSAERYIRAIAEISGKKDLGTIEAYFERAADSRFASLASRTAGSMKLSVSERSLEELTEASILGCFAYDLVDDCIDERKSIEILPIALAALSRMTRLFASSGSDELDEAALGILDRTDKAMLFESTLPSSDTPAIETIERLSGERSLAAILPAMHLFHQASFPPKSEEFLSFSSFFSHYLCAKQLHDDAHDISDDVDADKLSLPILITIEELTEKGLKPEKSLIKKTFWHRPLRRTCSLIFDHIEQARNHLYACRAIKDTTFFEAILKRLEESAEKAIEEKHALELFLVHFYPSQVARKTV